MIALVSTWAGAAFAQSSPVPPGLLNGGATITSPFTASYGDSFTSAQPQVGTTGYSFTDAYVFTTGVPGSFDSLSVTINLGSVLNIINFQAGVFNGTPLGASGGSFIGNSGSTSGAVSGLAWNSGSNGMVQLSDTSLPSGTYTLEIRGWVTGTNGGSYAGVLNIAPVPEPGTVAMMLAGLALAGLTVARRSAQR